MEDAFHEKGVGLGSVREEDVIVELLFEKRVYIQSKDSCGRAGHVRWGAEERGGEVKNKKKGGKDKGQGTGGEENIYQV